MKRLGVIILSLCMVLNVWMLPVYGNDGFVSDVDENVDENVDVENVEVDEGSIPDVDRIDPMVEEEKEEKRDEEVEDTNRDLCEDVLVSEVVNGVEVTLKASADAFKEEGTLSLRVEEIVDNRVVNAVKTVEDTILSKGNMELNSYRLFDITPMVEGVKVQPVKPVTISYKNLTLLGEDGKEIDVRQAVEESLNESSAKLLDTKEDVVGQIVAYHFDDPNTPNEIGLDANQEEMITEASSFSWYLIAEGRLSGDEYDVGKGRQKQSYEQESGIGEDAYTLDYILSNYNVFCSGDYLGTHVVGPMVVGGELMLNGSLGGMSGNTGDKYVHTAPSYIEGYAFNKNSIHSMPQIITDNGNMAAYLGKSNIRPDSHSINYDPYFKTPESAYTNDIVMDTSKLYVDFAEVFPTNIQSLDNQGKPIKKTTGNLPEYKVNMSDPLVDPSAREWNKNKGSTNYETDKVVPNGVLYDGPSDGSKRGTINHYRNFDGKDINGRSVKKVHIEQRFITSILEETNDGVGELRDGSELNGDQAKDRLEGYSRYYTLDDSGKVVPVKKLNDMNCGRGALKEDLTVENGCSKLEYVFAIDTLSTQFKSLNSNENANRDEQKDTIDVTVSLRPGYNFTFDHLFTGKKVDGQEGVVANVIYDYIDDKEMSGRLTIINVNDNHERIMIPRIYKSVKDDLFGDNYMFSSIENGPAFSVLWFAPYVREVYVGFKTADLLPNSSKLVGHLVVPQADVWVGGGDYNGGIIARNIDASSSGAEGHMWPFIIGSFVNGVQIHGTKKIDGVSPGEKDKFYFKWKLKKKNESGEFVDVDSNYWNVVTNDSRGDIRIKLDGNEYFKQDKLGTGGYQIYIDEVNTLEEFKNLTPTQKSKITEYNPTSQSMEVMSEEAFTSYLSKYTFDKIMYRGEFEIKEDNSLNPSIEIDPSLNMHWSYNKGGEESGNFQEYKNLSIEFNNSMKKPMTVNKKWFEKDGTTEIQDTSSLGPIYYDVYRESAKPEGFEVKVNIYSNTNYFVPSNTVLASSTVIGYVGLGEDISLNISCADMYVDPNTPISQDFPEGNKLNSAKIDWTSLENNIKVKGAKKGTPEMLELTRGSYNYYGCKLHLKNVTDNVTIDVYYTVQEPTLKKDSIDVDKEHEYVYAGGYSTGKEITRRIDGQEYKVMNRTITPKEEHFTIDFNDGNGGQYDNHWVYPQFDITKAELILKDQELSYENHWMNVHDNLKVKDSKGNVYYYKIVEKNVAGYESCIENPIFTLVGDSSKQITIKNVKKDIIDLQINKKNSSGDLILNNHAKFNLYKDEVNDSKKVCFNLKGPGMYEYVDFKTYYPKDSLKYVDLETSDEGIVKISGLNPGQYFLQEVMSPNGYQIEDRLISIVVDKDLTVSLAWVDKSSHQDPSVGFTDLTKENEIYQLDFENKMNGGPALPGTGGLGLFKVMIVGLTFVSIGLWLLERQRRHAMGGKPLS